MSPGGALLVALSAVIVLGAVATWLINIPLWAIGAGVVGAAFVVRRIFVRFYGRARQDTETNV
jgi:Flp pilus assembly protein TadB